MTKLWAAGIIGAMQYIYIILIFVFLKGLYFFFFLSFFLFFFFFGFMRQSFSVALEPVLELVLVDQVGLKLRDSPASTSRVLGLKACATTGWSEMF